MISKVEPVILHHENIHHTAIKRYLNDLANHGLLKYRLSNVPSPIPSDFTPSYLTFFILDNISSLIIGEFTLDTPLGAGYAIHFSAHPSLAPFTALTVARMAVDTIFLWRQPDKHTAYTRALYGLTPLPNKPALAFISRLGFKQLTLLPWAAYYDDNPCDAVVSCLENPWPLL